jgi:hypothetical protein
MASVVKSMSLEAFKASNNTATLNVVKSSKGNLFAQDSAGNSLASVASDLDVAKNVRALNMMDEATGETWWFIANYEAPESVFTL